MAAICLSAKEPNSDFDFQILMLPIFIMDEHQRAHRRDICCFIAIIETLHKEIMILKKRKYYRDYKRIYGAKIKNKVAKKCLKMTRKKSDNPSIVAFD